MRSLGRQVGVPDGIATGVGEGAVRADRSSQGTIDPEGLGSSVAGGWGVGLADDPVGGTVATAPDARTEPAWLREGEAALPHAATNDAPSSAPERARSLRLVIGYRVDSGG